MNASWLEARDLHKTYVGLKMPVRVLRGASLDLEAGETLAVVGRSGAGKSTLLYILGALHRPDRGTVRVGGEDLYAMPEGRRTALRASWFGFVFQSYHLLPEMNVLENVMLPGLAVPARGSPRRLLRRRAKDLLAAVGLADRADHTPMELSGGEQQRVALARALMNEPRLILADEPTGNLDERTASQVLDLLFSLAREKVRSLILVTHNPALAARCDRILHLQEGTLHAVFSGAVVKV